MVDVRDSMRIPTPRDDRAKTDHRNILGVVVDVDESHASVDKTRSSEHSVFVVISFSCANNSYFIDSTLATRELRERTKVH